ncbi:MAG: hypothetical protein H7Y09_09200 [Chitinophagaceae bacterium]|nr:hypothetical protein [Anaerolineae bacterium]
MPITVEWDDAEKLALRYTYPEIWTWDDLFLAIAQGDALLDEVNSKVFIIIDLRQNKTLPPNVLVHARNIFKHIHPHSGDNIVIGMNRFVRAMADTFSRLFGTIMPIPQTVETLEEAHAFIAYHASLVTTVSAMRD